MPKIVFFNQMAGRLFRELAQEMATAWNPCVLFTGHPDTIRIGSTKHLSVLPAPVYDKRSLFKRIVSWLKYFLFSLYQSLKTNRDSVLFFSTNPPILGIIGWINKKLFGKRYIILVLDIYPDIPITLGWLKENELIARIWRFLNKLSYENAEAIFTIGEYMAKNLKRQFDPRKTTIGTIEVISPWVDTNFIKPIKKTDNWFARKYNQIDKITILYSGNLGATHDITKIVELAKGFKEDPKIHFMVIGNGYRQKTLSEQIEKENLPNITLLPHQPENILPYSLAAGDISIITMHPGIDGYMVPSSFSYYLAAGCHLWYFGDSESEIGSICLEPENLGIIFERGKPVMESAKNAIKTMVHERPSPLSAYEYAKANFPKGKSIAVILKKISID